MSLMKTLEFGNTTVSLILEHRGPFMNPLDLYPEATAEAVEGHREWVHAQGLIDPASGQCIFSFHSFLVRTIHHTILIDTCVGEDKERPGRPHWNRRKWPWMNNLTAQGVTPADVDIVLCTHLHPDHVGWNTRLDNGRWVPTFPNARYVFGRTEYEHWSSRPKENRHAAYDDSVLPIVDAGRADLVDGDYEIEKGLWFEPAPGHTPGHMAIRLEQGGRRGLFTGDAVHHALQVSEPGWSTVFCADAAQSRETRTRLLESSADSDIVIMPQHFPNSTAGRVVSRGGRMTYAFI